jgi:hypothetical protein
VVTLLILAVSGQWAILESAAYLGMVVSYSKNGSFKEAVSILATFMGGGLLQQERVFTK